MLHKLFSEGWKDEWHSFATPNTNQETMACAERGRAPQLDLLGTSRGCNRRRTTVQGTRVGCGGHEVVPFPGCLAQMQAPGACSKESAPRRG